MFPDSRSHSLRSPGEYERKERLRRAVYVVCCLPSFVVLIWVVFVLARKSSPPPPLWTEADLPLVPAQADNGWDSIVRSEGSPPMLSIPRALTQILEAGIGSAPKNPVEMA